MVPESRRGGGGESDYSSLGLFAEVDELRVEEFSG